MAELLTQRRRTTAFIADNPTSLVLVRGTNREDDGAGGWTTTPNSLPAQVLRVVQQKQGSGVERRNSAGEEVSPTITLVCEYDADVKRNDTFTWQGLKAEVVWVTDLRYVKHAEVAI